MEGEVDGLALLPVTTTFHQEKVLTRCSGRALGAMVEGYQIHHGQVVADQVTAEPGAERWLQLDHGGADSARPDGVRVGPVLGTTLHGLFDSDDFRRRFLTEVAERAATSYSPGGLSPAARRDQELDRLADHLELSLDIEAIRALVDQSGRQPVGPGARVR